MILVALTIMVFGANAAAQELMTQAKNIIRPRQGLLCRFMPGPDYDEAEDLFKQAANQFKIGKQWQDAADAFEQCAHCAQQTGSHQEAQYLVEAGNVMKRLDTDQALEYFERAVALFSADGKFGSAGKVLQNSAEMVEVERREQQARNLYKRASEMFDLDEHGKSKFTECILKYADYVSKEGQLNEAIEIYEREGAKALESQILRFRALRHFFKAGILHLVQDSVNFEIALARYRNTVPEFLASREGQTLEAVAEAVTQNNIETFENTLYEYDNMKHLDAWETHFFTMIKVQMESVRDIDEINLT